MLYITQGKEPSDFEAAGISYVCCHHIRFRTPVWCINVPTALEVYSNGKGGTVLFFACFNL